MSFFWHDVALDHRFFLASGDGSYAVHMIKISWPHHVFVSEAFQVTGAFG